jgi:hypothetical protein
MKKKLVSILLSLTMCASYATPFTTVAANEVPDEDITVVETVAPNAELEPVTTSKDAFKIATSGTSIKLEYGDELEVKNQNYWKLASCSWMATESTFKSGIDYDVAAPTLTLAKANDSKYLTINGNKITAENITKATVPVILHVTATDAVNHETESSEIKLNVTVSPKDLSKVDTSKIEAAYDKAAEGKTYNTLDEFAKKYKGAKGFTAKVTLDSGDKTLAKSDISKISAFVDTDTAEPQKEGTSQVHYYTVKGDTSSVDHKAAVVTVAGIKVEGKGNYKGSFTITNQAVSLQPQRLNIPDVGTISGTTVTYGSISAGNLTIGLSVDEGDALGEDANAINKLYKFTAANKDTNQMIKIDAKNGMVTVKKVPEENKRVATIIITNKKNKLCVGKVQFNVAPQTISDDAFETNFDKVIGTEDKPKTYKNFLDFESKFIGKDNKKPKASGMTFTYTDEENGLKPVKLKANRDFKVTYKVNAGSGTDTGKSNAAKKEKLEPTAYFTSDGSVATSAMIVIEGMGNYCGVHTEAAVEIPMEIQTISAAGAAFTDSAKKVTVTYGGIETVNIFDNISINNAIKDNKPVALSEDSSLDKDAVIKLLKVKPDKESGLKVDKEGNVTVKKVGGNGKIYVSSKKNNKSVDAYQEVLFRVDPITSTDAQVRFNTDGIEGKEFNNATAAKKAAEKVSLTSTIFGKDTKLRFGTDKDYKTFTIKQVKATNDDSNPESVTGPSLCYKITAELANNYQGTVSTYVNCTAKK